MQLDEEVGALLRHLDHPLPSVQATELMKRAGRRPWTWMGKAAAMLLIVGAGGIAWAAPGSVLPSLVAKATTWIVGARTAQVRPVPVAAPAPAPAPVPSPAFSGVAVSPGAHLIIAFSSTQTEGAARVSLADASDVSVRTAVGAAAFTSTDDRLIIDNAKSRATFEIVIPRNAARVEILVEGRRVFEKVGLRVTARNAQQSRDLYVLPLARSGANRP